MSVTFPIGDLHVPLDIPFVRSIPINSNGSMHKIGAGLPIPKSELNDFNKSSSGRSKSGSERSGIPKRLPFKLRPFFRNVTTRFPHPKKVLIESLQVDGENGCSRRPFLSCGSHKTIEYNVIIYSE